MAIRTGIIGCVELSKRLFDVAVRSPAVEVVAVVSREQSPRNSDFFSLGPPAQEHGIPVHMARGRDDKEIRDFFIQQRVDLGLCVGWSYLLSDEVIRIASKGFIGYHPSELPKNRGRHPFIWALALGLKETASTFFMLETNADEGPVLDQQRVLIEQGDDARRLYDKIAKVAEAQLESILPAYIEGVLQPVSQDTELANNWRKRSAADGRIDWRMNFEAIDCLVRALRPPYPGATCGYEGHDIVISMVAPGPDAPTNIEPGKVLGVNGRELIVKCWGGSVRIVGHEFTSLPMEGAYLF